MQKAESRKGIRCPFCEHVHDATDNEIEGQLSGRTECEECDRAFWFFADYDVTWHSQSQPL